jgi:alkanesulfonate monooxygenase SsuD/methylene tetrahydromethanopterin reductase-like flavin-dependent oxidoreductase (luciferase family)
VTPLARRRPVKVARETAALDLLSGGRLTLGVGLGSDHFASEYSMTGEELDDRRRARMLDEALGILEAAWSGADPAPYREAGATWWLVAPEWEEISVDRVRGVIRELPA